MDIETTLVGESPAVKRLRKEIPKLARRQSHVLVKGQSGSGKGLVAQLLLGASGSKGRLIVLSPSNATDAEINSALLAKPSEVAMFLIRDIEDFSYLQQTLIQRFIERLPKRPFVPIVVTTKQAIGDSLKERDLIEGLHHALKSFESISIPPLSQRAADVPFLVDHFVKKACEGVGTKVKVIDVNTLDFLIRREWKENVRELRSVIERSVFNSMNSDSLELPESLVDEYRQLDGILENIKLRRAFLFDKALYNLEKTLIERTLDMVSFNQSKAADVLHLSEANLRYRMKKFHIPTMSEKK